MSTTNIIKREVNGFSSGLLFPRIALYEDQRAFREHFAEFLKRKAIRVEQFSDFDRALRAINSNDYDAGVFDVNNEGLHPVGLELAARFLQRFPDRPCFCITGYDGYEYQVTELGAKYFLKPIRPEKEGAVIFAEIWSKYVERRRNSAPPQYVANVEDIHDGTITVSFEDKKLGWVLLELRPGANTMEVAPGDSLIVSELYDGDGTFQGFHILPDVERQSDVAEEPPKPPQDFEDPKQLKAYLEDLKKFMEGH